MIAHRRRDASLLVVIAMGVGATGAALGASAGCARPQAPAPVPGAAVPAPASVPAAAPASAPIAAAEPAAAPAPPRDLASATRDNPLRPEALPGPEVRNSVEPPTADPPRLAALKLPPGFSIEVYATGVTNARSLALGAPGIVYVSTRRDKRVFAVVDRNRDHKVDKVYTIAQGLDVPNGIAYRDGNLYIAQIGRLLRLDGIDRRLANPPAPVVIKDDLPTLEHHGWRYIRFGPDGWLYMPIGAPCNICKRDEPMFGTIARMKPDGTGFEVFASGVRNSVGFDWHPETHELWFTDNGRDSLGNDIPPDELDHAPRAGMHFGFPHCHAGVIRDPEFGDRPCTEFEPPVQLLGPHVAALGMRFYTGKMFPPAYRNAIILAEHGSWNREHKLGYRVMVVRLDGDKAVSYEPLVSGWLDERDQAWGRPVDVEVLDDGSLLISDDYKGVLYRVTYRR
ncbi:MAG TPA: PQQ-dependent sugar dehydrogenase [Kofleriaceae bacterium]